MPLFTRRAVRACLLTAFWTFAPAAFAGIIAPNPSLPPATGSYSVPDACISVVCLENIMLSNFDVTSATIVGGNEVTQSNVDLTANLFQNLSGTPGGFINSVLLAGQVDITYFSRTDLSEAGTFNALITSLNLTGSFVGLTGAHTLTAMLNPAESSTGQTTVTPLGTSPETFQINSFFDVFAELSIDGGPPVPGPERVADLSATPEPAFYGPLSLILAFLAVWRNRRRLVSRFSVS